MATNTRTTVPSAIAALEAESHARAEGLKQTAQLLADRLAQVMQELHGGKWGTCMMHNPGSEFAVVRPQLDRTINPKRGEIV